MRLRLWCAPLILALSALRLPAQSLNIVEYPVTVNPPAPGLLDIAFGSDGAMYVPVYANNIIARVTTSGAVTQIPIPGPSLLFAFRITPGPDGALWYVSSILSIGRLTTSGQVTTFSVPGSPNLTGITTGPDGALWFTGFGQNGGTTGFVGRLTTSGAFSIFNVSLRPQAITTGPDGALWFPENFIDALGNPGIGKIGRITTAGALTEYAIPTTGSYTNAITAGPDGALWFTEFVTDKIGRITTSGTITEFPLPTPVSFPQGIVAGGDGALWFGETQAGRIGRITTSGTVSEYRLPTAGGDPVALTLGPDSGVWFVEGSTNKVGRVGLGIVTPSLQSSPANSPYPSVTLQGQAGTAPYTWSATGLPPGMTLSAAGVLSGTPTSVGSFSPIISVSDSSTPQQTAQFTYTLSITQGGAPGLTVTAACPATTGTLGQPYTFAVSVTGGTAPYTWSLTSGALPAGLSLAAATGAISGTPTASGTFPITILITDSAVLTPPHTATYTCSIVVTPAFAITSACPVAAGMVNQPYTLPLAVTGGAAPYTWSLTGGSLPTGVTLNTASGVISGTTTASGTFPFTVQVTDAAGLRATFSCSLVINPGLSVTTVCPVTPAFVNQPYSLTLGTSAGTLPLSWTLTSGALPPGLALNAISGAISGTPAAGGTFPFSVQVTDASGQRATFSCSLVVNTVAPLALTCPAGFGTLNQPYSSSFSATGGVGPYVFNLVSGALPAGLSFNSALGSIGGTPSAAGSSSFGVQVTDSAAATARQSQTVNCTITVGALRLQITSGCPASMATQGAPYFQTLSGTGGSGGISWAISIGSLPAGLTLVGNRIFGSPTGPPGTTQFSISANTDDQFAQISCSITVTGPALQITSGCPSGGMQNAPYGPFVLSATGGPAPANYVFSIVSGALPPGLTLNGNSIVGTPQGPPGSSTFGVQVVNGSQSALAGPCTLSIAPPALSVSGTCPASGQLGTPLSIPFAVTGGTLPYSFSLSGPSWLSIGGSSVAGTPPASGPAAFSVTVTDSAKSAKVFSCSFPITGPPLTISGACPGATTPLGNSVGLSFTASGGQPPYNWTFAGPSWLSLSSSTGGSVALAGTPPATGAFSFSVTLSDSAGTPPAVFSCTLNVTPPAIPPLLITPTGGCPTSPLAFQSAFALSLTGSGGTPPYAWAFNGPSFLALSGTTGSATSVTGSANTAGTFPFAVTLRDSANATPAVFNCSLTVNPAVIPSISLAGLAPPADPFTPVSANLSLGSAAPVPLTGTVQLTFIPNATNGLDNPQVHFSDPCLRSCSFTIPAGSSTIPLPNIETGTVAGTIHVEVVSLSDAGRDVLPAAHPSGDIVIQRSKPVITAITFANETATGFDVVVAGYSTPRDVTSAAITISPKQGQSISGTTQFSFDITNLFNGFYQSSQSAAGGSMFTGLHIPVSVTGSKNNIGSVTVTLSNSAGNSDPVTKAR